MDEPQSAIDEKELLVLIHNQLVDLTQVIVEIELARPGASHSLQTRLRSIIGSTEHLDTGGNSVGNRQKEHKFIAPPTGMSDESK